MARGMEYLVVKADQAAADLIRSDINELKIAAERLVGDACKLGRQWGFATHFLKWLASFAAIYLLILDRTNWRSNMLTSLLVPYIFFSLPSGLFHLLSCLEAIFPRHFPDWLEIPGSLILVLVVAPDFFAVDVKDSWAGTAILLVIGCYLLQQHIRATGGFKNSFTQSTGISNTAGLLLLLAYPLWALVLLLM
ncbi:hypothetical protein Nepgr_008291 [Nepenthes gracilis]|uniref:Uncharacterized protein n=1 Tax=Nepenthes gracilis TaxID=150966 RepID=A0AAD3XJA8_NEPGR|nr:hypothetical protein Nepgr_008291 [Nepenthes gracilis]